MKKITVVDDLLLLSTDAYSKTTQHQSIGTVGSSNSSDSITISAVDSSSGNLQNGAHRTGVKVCIINTTKLRFLIVQ
jgi:hypothetical protein